ncbi:hypothetical protein HNR19_003241 [Nocardioides thalensis]|uniref:DUF559 domain-containing protein n=1 Tax=Nocardioides thalensis TaxID=1914755 RepID=A0A853C8L0_9ACTN|nr:DUF559 domain-containing protein [Nocardioides thalensis]NYJ02543.1 hypothetical protein [Nocardioides thalensis]
MKDLGITRATLRRLVHERQLRRVTTDVYVAADVEDTLETRVQAISLVISPHHVIADRAAAWLWGIDAFAYADLDAPPIETVALPGHYPCRRQAVRGRTRDLAADEIVTVGGVRVTSPLRTALDLGCVLHRADALAALDAFRRAHDISEAELVGQLPRFAGRRGVVQLKELIPLSDPRAESARESRTRLAILDAGLPAPDLQVWVDVAGRPTYRLDHAYVRARIAVEYDGWEAHQRTDDQRRYDEERRAWLRQNGWHVIVVRNGDFTGPALDAWTLELREALRWTYSTRRRLERGDGDRVL